MILNVSGRTDIVMYYLPRLINRIKEGYVDVRNPFYKKLVNRIYFNDVDLYFFISKDPTNILDKIDYFKDKPIIFHVTLTPYKEDIEPNIVNKKKVIESIKKLSLILGKENVVVRYDPIFISDKYSVDYHIKAFNKLCYELNGYIEVVIVSFLDLYKNVIKNKNIIKYKELTNEKYKNIGLSFSSIAKANNIKVQTCFEDNDLVEYGFNKGECLSKELAFKLTNKNFKKWKARKGNKCKCVELVDIGFYNTCLNKCKYCYANFDEKEIDDLVKLHDPNSSLLIGHLEEDDIIKIRK